MSEDTFWLLAWIAFVVYFAVFSIRKKLDEIGTRIVWAISTPEEREQEAAREHEWDRRGRQTVFIAVEIVVAIVVAGVAVWWVLQRTP
jgi:hypothetical protein